MCGHELLCSIWDPLAAAEHLPDCVTLKLLFLILSVDARLKESDELAFELDNQFDELTAEMNEATERFNDMCVRTHLAPSSARLACDIDFLVKVSFFFALKVLTGIAILRLLDVTSVENDSQNGDKKQRFHMSLYSTYARSGSSTPCFEFALSSLLLRLEKCYQLGSPGERC